MATLVDSYSESNAGASVFLDPDDYQGSGQSFTPGSTGTLNSMVFFVRKSAGMTGTANAKIYAHSGTFGTSSVPTGSALATSDNFDVSTLGTSSALHTFTFSGANKIKLTSGINYVLTLEFAGGSSSTGISAGKDISSPTHGGNHSVLIGGSWFAESGDDFCFYIYFDTPSLLDTYSETNQNSFAALYSGNWIEYGQTFMSGSGGVLNSAKFYLNKTGSPTGNATAALYAHTGSFGAGGTATGSALATSDNVDVSTLAGSLTITEFIFSGVQKVTLSPDTAYAIVVQYSSGDSSNRVDIGLDTTSPTHSGNRTSYLSNWNGNATQDTPFYVYIDARSGIRQIITNVS